MDEEQIEAWKAGGAPRPMVRADGIPTRIDTRWMTEAETAICDAMHAVEKAGGSPALTQAVTMLSAARSMVANHVEGNGDTVFAGPFVPRAEHDRRVSELLQANNDLLIRLRECQRTADDKIDTANQMVSLLLKQADAALWTVQHTIHKFHRATFENGIAMLPEKQWMKIRDRLIDLQYRLEMRALAPTSESVNEEAR